MKTMCFHHQRGLALITALWAIALLTIMAASFSLSLQRDTNLVKFNEDRAKGAALADAAVHYAMLKVNSAQSRPASNPANLGLSTGASESRWRTDGFPCPVQLPTGNAIVRIFDETGKVNLNALANPNGLPVLRAVLMQVFDGDQDRADNFADAIIDWVDADQLTRPNGAEASDYESANKGYVPPDREFQAMEELLMVMVDKTTGETLSPKIFQKLEPMLTIYSGSPMVNPSKASRAALATIPLKCMDKSAAAQHWEMRCNSCFELPQTQQPAALPVAIMQLPDAVGCIQGNSPGQVFTVYAYTKSQEGQITAVKAIIARRLNQANNGSPFTFLSWKQLPSAIADESETQNSLHLP